MAQTEITVAGPDLKAQAYISTDSAPAGTAALQRSVQSEISGPLADAKPPAQTSQPTEKAQTSQPGEKPQAIQPTDSKTDPAKQPEAKSWTEDVASKLWITTGGISHHLDRSRHFNEENYGIGIEYKFDRDKALAIGEYKNSIYRTSHYATFNYTPLHMGPVSLGLMAGAVDGYYMNHGGPIPLVLPLASVETKHAGINLTYIPKLKEVSPTIGLQFKFHF